MISKEEKTTYGFSELLLIYALMNIHVLNWSLEIC